jgi:uncharacterized protein YycO
VYTKLINGLIGGFKWLFFHKDDKTKPYKTDGNDDFLVAIKKPGTVCCIGGEGFLQDGIKDATNSFWCHTFGITEEGWCIEAEGGGIQHNQIDKYLGDTYQIAAFQTDLTDDQLKELLTWIRSQVGKPYGFVEFLEELLPDPDSVPIKDQSHICSSLWACGFFKLDIDIVPKDIDPRLATPGDVFNGLSPNLNFKMYRYNW